MTTAVDVTSAQNPALVRLLASSATLRGHIGATTYAQAINRIKEYEVFDGSDPNNVDQVITPRPRAWVEDVPGWGMQRYAVGEFRAYGSLYVNIELIPPGDVWAGLPAIHDTSAEHRWFKEQLSAIMGEMADTFNALSTGDSLPIFSLMEMQCPVCGPCISADEEQYFWGAIFIVPYTTK